METGEYEKAGDAYEKMMQREESLYSYSRRAGLKSMRGDSAGAIADLQSAIAAGKAAKQAAESVAWTEWRLGSDHFASANWIKPRRFTASRWRPTLITIAPWRVWDRCARRRKDMRKQSIRITRHRDSADAGICRRFWRHLP